MNRTVMCLLLGLAWAGCSKNPQPSMSETAAQEARAAAPADKATPADKAPAGQGGAFADYVDLFPALELPVELPLLPAAVAEVETRALADADRRSYLCGTRYFDCDGVEGRYYMAYRLKISDQARGLLYYIVSSAGTQLVLMTYDMSGRIVNGLVLAGDFDSMKYGFDGEIRADRTIVRNHYVWVDGEEKEYVKDRRFRITATGGIEETVL